jgi:signal transduction histidine kinase
MTYDLEATDLTQLMEEAVENNQSFADGFKVSMDCRHPDGEVMVNGDNRRLMQVLTNLLSNAIKYSPQGDRVALTVEKRDGWARVSVADNGPGVPEDFRGKLFGRFAQAENLDTRERGGSGLGLSISKAIVEQHQGRVGFDTELGKGSTFYFDLPLLEPSYTKER